MCVGYVILNTSPYGIIRQNPKSPYYQWLEGLKVSFSNTICRYNKRTATHKNKATPAGEQNDAKNHWEHPVISRTMYVNGWNDAVSIRRCARDLHFIVISMAIWTTLWYTCNEKNGGMVMSEGFLSSSSDAMKLARRYRFWILTTKACKMESIITNWPTKMLHWFEA